MQEHATYHRHSQDTCEQMQEQDISEEHPSAYAANTGKQCKNMHRDICNAGIVQGIKRNKNFKSRTLDPKTKERFT